LTDLSLNEAEIQGCCQQSDIKFFSILLLEHFYIRIALKDKAKKDRIREIFALTPYINLTL